MTSIRDSKRAHRTISLRLALDMGKRQREPWTLVLTWKRRIGARNSDVPYSIFARRGRASQKANLELPNPEGGERQYRQGWPQPRATTSSFMVLFLERLVARSTTAATANTSICTAKQRLQMSMSRRQRRVVSEDGRSRRKPIANGRRSKTETTSCDSSKMIEPRTRPESGVVFFGDAG